MFEEMFGSENEPLPGAPGAQEAPQAAPPESAPAETPPAAAAPAETPPAPAAAAPAETSPGAEPQQSHVPIGALTEERARRRELQEQNQQLQARFNEVLMRLSQQPQAQPQQPAVQIPAFEDNPAEHLRAVQQQYERQLQELRDQVAGHNQRTQAVDQHSQFVSMVAAQEAEFAARTPDYHAATAFVQQRKLAEYRAVGLDDVAARQALARDTQAVAQLALQRGQNPAEVMYGLARTIGYTGQNPPPGAAQTAAQQRPAAPSSLQSAGGAPGADNSGAPTPEALAQMTDAEFDVWWNKFAGAQQGSRLQ